MSRVVASMANGNIYIFTILICEVLKKNVNNRISKVNSAECQAQRITFFLCLKERRKKNWLQKSLADEVEMKFSGEFFILFPIIKASGDTRRLDDRMMWPLGKNHEIECFI